MKIIRQTYGTVKVLGIDNVPGATAIDTYNWDSNTHYVLAFGQEQVGLPAEILDICDAVLYIKQYGTVRSLNVGTASGIAMYALASNVF